MKDFRTVITSVASLACVLSLAACGSSHSKATQPEVSAALPANLTLAPLQNCPQTGILQQAQAVTLFLPDRQDVAAQISTGRITGISGACSPNGAQKPLKVQFTVSFEANNGPANAGKPITLPWFVAITRGDQIIEKHLYKITLSFNGNMSVTTATSQPIKIEVPNVPRSAGIQILTGFQMSKAELAYAANHAATP